MLSKRQPENVICSSDLDRLQRLFDEACKSQGIDLASSQAEVLAAHVITLFQEGMKDEDIRNELGIPA